MLLAASNSYENPYTLVHLSRTLSILIATGLPNCGSQEAIGASHRPHRSFSLQAARLATSPKIAIPNQIIQMLEIALRGRKSGLEIQ